MWQYTTTIINVITSSYYSPPSLPLASLCTLNKFNITCIFLPFFLLPTITLFFLFLHAPKYHCSYLQSFWQGPLLSCNCFSHLSSHISSHFFKPGSHHNPRQCVWHLRFCMDSICNPRDQSGIAHRQNLHKMFLGSVMYGQESGTMSGSPTSFVFLLSAIPTLCIFPIHPLIQSSLKPNMHPTNHLSNSAV